MATSNCSNISCSSTDIKEEDFEFAHLREFFDDSDWLRMAEIDKRRCAQLLRNYELLRQFGASPPVPDFLRKSISPPKLRQSQRKKRKSTRYLQVRIKPNRTGKRIFIEDEDDDTKNAPDMNITIKVASQSSNVGATQSCGIVRSSRRLHQKRVSKVLADKSPAAQSCTKVLSFANDETKEVHHKPARLRPHAKRVSRDLSRVNSRCVRLRVAYACAQRYCSKRFARLRLLLAHFKVCSEARLRAANLHRCERCEASFRFSASLTAHTTRRHMPRLFFCKHCDIVDLTSAAYRKHILQCPTKAIACAVCGKQLATVLRLRRHFFRTHPTLRYFKCPLCPLTFVNPPGLLRHVQRAHRPKNSDYKCGICGKTYRNRSAFWLHKKSHDMPTFACEVCGRSFHTKSFLARHARLHTESRPFLCEICGASFKQHAHLRTHEAEVCKLDSSKPPCFACEKCGLAFKRKSQLQRHFNRKHSASAKSKSANHLPDTSPPAGLKQKKLEASFDCLVCGAKFKSKAGLKRHAANVHVLGQSSNATFACGFCGRIFKCQEYLSKHLLCVHNKMDGDEPAIAGWSPEKFACSVCPKSFKSEGYVRRHEQVRHGIAKKADPFECKRCGISFRRRDYLKRHEANLHPSTDLPSHASTASLPSTKSTAPIVASQNLEVASGAVSCQFCGKLFSTETFLRAHEDAVHGSAFNGVLNNFLCRLCNSGFRRRRHLLRHFAAAHGAVPKQEPLSRDLDLAATMATATEPILSPQRQDVLFANASGASTFVLVAAPVVNPAPIPCFIIPARQIVTMATDPNAKNNSQIGVDSAPTEFSTDQFFAFLTETNEFRL